MEAWSIRPIGVGLCFAEVVVETDGSRCVVAAEAAALYWKRFEVKAVVLADVRHEADVCVDAELFRNFVLWRKADDTLYHFVYGAFLGLEKLGWARDKCFVPHGSVTTTYVELKTQTFGEVVHVEDVGEVEDRLHAETQSLGAWVAVFEFEVVKTDIEFKTNAVVEHVAVVGFVMAETVNAGSVEGVVHAVVAADRKPYRRAVEFLCGSV